MPRFHFGTNSLITLLLLTMCGIAAYSSGRLSLDYIKGLEPSLTFSIGVASTILGFIFCRFWRFDGLSLYSFHFSHYNPYQKNTVEIFRYKSSAFFIAHDTTLPRAELPKSLRKSFCILSFFCITLLCIDNRNFYKLMALPNTLFTSNTEYCPESLEGAGKLAEAPAGCELVIRAFELGYTKDLGQCAPKKLSKEELSVCTQRRIGEPYLHYAYRLLFDSMNDLVTATRENNLDNLQKKFNLQWEQIEALKDYQLYAISAAPRASHHIWTNLPSPEAGLLNLVKESLNLDHCLKRFQNQNNTASSPHEDHRRESVFLDHAYGQLLFSPKVERTVAFCREYKIHWGSSMNTCDRLASSPNKVLDEFNILEDIQLVLKRHDVTASIARLDEILQNVVRLEDNKSTNSSSNAETETEYRVGKKQQIQIDTSKIASNKHFREKTDLVSFTCFMQDDVNKAKQTTISTRVNGTVFPVDTRTFPALDGGGESQLQIYQQFAKALNRNFHYSHYKSRSNLNVETDAADKQTDDNQFLLEDNYVLSRLFVLNDVDIFLENDWVLERKDLLEVYPFHVHQQNYIDSFRIEYQQDHGRL